MFCPKPTTSALLSDGHVQVRPLSTYDVRRAVVKGHDPLLLLTSLRFLVPLVVGSPPVRKDWISAVPAVPPERAVAIRKDAPNRVDAAAAYALSVDCRRTPQVSVGRVVAGRLKTTRTRRSVLFVPTRGTAVLMDAQAPLSIAAASTAPGQMATTTPATARPSDELVNRLGTHTQAEVASWDRDHVGGGEGRERPLIKSSSGSAVERALAKAGQQTQRQWLAATMNTQWLHVHEPPAHSEAFFNDQA